MSKERKDKISFGEKCIKYFYMWVEWATFTDNFSLSGLKFRIESTDESIHLGIQCIVDTWTWSQNISQYLY